MTDTDASVGRFVGGPLDGAPIPQPRNHTRYRGEGDGLPIHGARGDSILRNDRTDTGGVYLLHITRDALGGVEHVTYVHSTNHHTAADAWRLVAVTLAGSHTARVIAGDRGHDPDALLRALADHVDDLIRLRHRIRGGPIDQPPAPGRLGPQPTVGQTA